MTALAAGRTRVYVANFMGDGDERIAVYRFDDGSGALELQSSIGAGAGVERPLYLEPDAAGRTLYAADCTVEWQTGGAICALAIDPGTGDLTPLGTAPSRGSIPVFVATTDRLVLTANCGPFRPSENDRTVTVLPRKAEGALGEPVCVVHHEGASVDAERQTSAHPHSVAVAPSGDFALVPDLGTDEIRVYRLDAGSGALTDHAVVRTDAGQGPRHLRFHPNGRFAYLDTEIGNRVIAYSWDASHGRLEQIQQASMLPDGAEDRAAAEIQIHPSGRFLYATNRTHESIAVFAIEPGSGRLTPLEHVPTRGKFPRGLALHPDGRWLIACNERSDSLVTYRVDADTGRLAPTGPETASPGPACACFVRLPASSSP